MSLNFERIRWRNSSLLYRRTSGSSRAAEEEDYHDQANANNSRNFVRDLRAQLASIPNPDHEFDLILYQHLDISLLKPLKVPTQTFFHVSSQKGSFSSFFLWFLCDLFS